MIKLHQDSPIHRDVDTVVFMNRTLYPEHADKVEKATRFLISMGFLPEKEDLDKVAYGKLFTCQDCKSPLAHHIKDEQEDYILCPECKKQLQEVFKKYTDEVLERKKYALHNPSQRS